MLDILLLVLLPIQGGVAMLLSMLHAKETWISSGFWFVCAFTFTFIFMHLALLGNQFMTRTMPTCER